MEHHKLNSSHPTKTLETHGLTTQTITELTATAIMDHDTEQGTGNNDTQDTDRDNQDKGAGRKDAKPMVRRPVFLRTAGHSQSISMDSIIEDTVGTFRCPKALKSKDKDIASFHDRVAWSIDKHNLGPQQSYVA